ncbi:nuclear transport factor 2 family protein [Egicoccus halophilus]|uniref:DUF4440 domain-containing protein n=1 Tax=Egicoccus halophilus TaxID=1670830 RepID=A0A8J3ET06_9ACTN|nr:nuclear transport factor 2 family protein [Egicoccus halophilus]GGI04208.1 hypothetical protein GCM10011354_07950 [Egicoccus halophilus]
MSDEQLAQELEAAERAFWSAGGDVEFYRDAVADELRCVFSVGILDRDATLRGVAQGAPWTDLELSELTVTPIAEDAAALVYRASAVPGGGGGRYETYVTSTYVRRDGRWRLLLHAHVPVADG